MRPSTPELERAVWNALATIEDPELPITVTDLGLIGDVSVEGGRVQVTMIPTFSACPAIGVMREDIRRRLEALPGVEEVTVELSFAEPWTMARMTQRGRQRLIQHGLSVPSRRPAGGVECPFCGSHNTSLENPFGPTLCRAIYYCHDCKNPIERFRSAAG
ncbi:MAG: 1,2-phenylacetyl-CoA epoxidase subunit PaaD [Gaiellales bacterium]